METLVVKSEELPKVVKITDTVTISTQKYRKSELEKLFGIVSNFATATVNLFALSGLLDMLVGMIRR